MAYIPPHKRHANVSERPLPTPYEMNTIYRWWMVGLTDDDQFPASVRLEKTVPLEYLAGRKKMHLVGGHPPREVNETTSSSGISPWVSIAEKILPDLLTALQDVRNGINVQKIQPVNPYFVARIGKILFDEDASIMLDTISRTSAVETALSPLRRSFHTDIPRSYMESILSGVIPKIGIDFSEEKERYILKVSDKSQPDIILSCKCKVMDTEGKLVFHQMEIRARHFLVADMSCIDKNLDLRLTLFTKRKLDMTDDELHGIRNLISSAIIDPNVEGGLRWPQGKESFGDRFSVVSVWHYKIKSFKKSPITLRLRDADRPGFDFSTREITREVVMKMPGINTQLRGQIVDIGSITQILQDMLKMIWDHFLSCDESYP